MRQSPAVLDEERLRRLTSELVAVIRREVPWYDGDMQDPGVMLVDLFAFVGDLLSQYEERLADDAYVGTAGRPRIAITVGGLQWRGGGSPPGAGAHPGPGLAGRDDARAAPPPPPPPRPAARAPPRRRPTGAAPPPGHPRLRRVSAGRGKWPSRRLRPLAPRASPGPRGARRRPSHALRADPAVVARLPGQSLQ